MATQTSVKTSESRAEDGRRKPRPGPEEQARIIVDAAVTLFLEQGVRAVSIKQICTGADVSRSTFYRSFDGVDALLQHIYSESVFQPVQTFMQANTDLEMVTAEKLRTTMDEMYEAIFQQGRYAELLFRESSDPSSPAYQVVNQAFDRIIASLQKVLPATDNKAVDAIYLKSLLNACQWIAHDAISQGLSAKRKKDAKAAAWRLAESVLTGAVLQSERASSEP